MRRRADVFGVADEAAALPLLDVHADAEPTDREEETAATLAAKRPRVLVYADPDDGWKHVEDAVGSYRSSGTLLVVFERATTGGEQHDNVTMINAMQIMLGRITDELFQQVRVEAAVAITAIDARGPWRGDDNSEADLGNRATGVLSISCGLGDE